MNKWHDLKVRTVNLCDHFLHRCHDFYYGTDTTTPLDCHELEVYNANLLCANRYEGSNRRAFLRVFDSMNLDWSKYTFVDLGAGKGRCMMLATRFGFKRIEGVEFSSKLVGICRKNLFRFQEKLSRQFDFRVHCCDVVDFDFLQKMPTIYFMFNPFDGNILRKIVGKMLLRDSSDHPDYLVYLNPVRSFHLEFLGLERAWQFDHWNSNREVYVYKLSSISSMRT